MRAVLSSMGCGVAAALFMSAACSADKKGGDPSGSGGAAATGGSTSEDDGGESGSGGMDGSGGDPGSGGAGTGGTGSTGCEAPGENQTAICLTFAPEDIELQSDPNYDGSGILVVHVFDRADPPDGDAGDAIARQILVYPPDPTTGDEIALSELPAPRIVIDDPPENLYVRAVFIDNVDAFAPGASLVPGVWTGGLDLSEGIREGVEITAIPVQAGAAKEAQLELTALRRLDITVNASATPVGDGEGPLAVVVTDRAEVVAGTPLPPFGLAIESCVDINDAPLQVTGAFIGEGPYYVLGALYDLPGPGELPLGSLSSLDVVPDPLSATIPHRLSAVGRAYSASITIDLNFLVPLPADAGAPPANACTDFP